MRRQRPLAQMRVGRIFVLLLAGALSGCGGEEERQPSAAEVQRFTSEIDKAEAAAKAEAVNASQSKEKAVEQKHLARVPAED